MNETRWNSENDLLESFLLNKTALISMIQEQNKRHQGRYYPEELQKNVFLISKMIKF